MAPIVDPPYPRYQCHKIVEALKIFDVVATPDGGALLYPHDARYAPVAVDPQWMAKHQPQAPGYWVRYPDSDGYTSWSPIEPFESGYTLFVTGRENLP